MRTQHRILIVLAMAIAWLPLRSTAAETVEWGLTWCADNSMYPTLSNPLIKLAHTIYPEQAMTITRVGIVAANLRAGAPVYRMGIQSNGVDNFPNGVWVGGAANYGTSALATSLAWNWVDLPAGVGLAANTRYHIVFEIESADASNYSSYWAASRTSPDEHRYESGVYDNLVGREYYSGAAWVRSSTLAMLALDTNAVRGIGQPYFSGWYQLAKGINRTGQIFTLTVPSPTGRHRLVAMGMRVLASKTTLPEDDCRIQLQRVSDNAILATQVLLDKTVLGNSTNAYVFVTTNLNTVVTVMHGEQYRIFISSTGCVSGYYRTAAKESKSSDPAVLSADFQGSDRYAVYSSDETTWTAYLYGSRKTDAKFLLTLEPIQPSGTIFSIR